ncbi:MAG: anthrone oxygenase family protein [Pseudomonadota bacterium]
MPIWLTLLTQFSILAFAVLGGVFLAFSDFLMRSLKKTGGRTGMEAMLSINREVFRYVFIPLFLAMVPVSIMLAVSASIILPKPHLFIGAALIYLLGAFAVTMFGNVPMNNRLEALRSETEEGLTYWEDRYLSVWTLYNSIRTAACILASGVLLFAMTSY